MSSATSIDGDKSDAPFALWHIYALLGMLAAAASVWVSRNTHPLALVLRRDTEHRFATDPTRP